MRYRFVIIALMLAFAAPAWAIDNPTANAASNKGSVSGLVLPRFATIRTDDVNMRTGPGTRYPIEWVYKHKGLPIEIFGEFEVWRRVRDADGAEGWVHKSALTSKRMAIVTGARNLLNDGTNGADVVAHLENGSIGQVLSCNPDWCRLKFEGVKGYLRKSEFWGAYPNETFN